MTLDDLAVFAYLDPAGGKRGLIKSVRARSAIVVIGVDCVDRIFVLRTWADRAPTEKIIEQVFKLQEQYHPKIFGIEASAQQSLFAGALSYIGRSTGRTAPLYPVNQPTKITKEFRIRTILQPIIAHGRLFIKEDMHELRSELQTFPVGITMDLVDALATACSLSPRRTGRAQVEQEQDDLQHYLADAGLRQSEIDMTMREIGHGDVGSDSDNGPLQYYSPGDSTARVW